MKRIALDGRVFSIPNPSGIPRYMKGLFGAMIEEKNDNHYFFWGSSEKYFKKANTSFMRPFLPPSYDINLDKLLSFMCHMHDVDICLGMTGGVPAKRRCPGIMILFDVIPMIYDKCKWNQNDLNFYRSILPKTLAHCDAVITISENSKADILQYYPFLKDRVFVAFPGVDDCFYENFEDENNSFIYHNKWAQEPYILSIASLDPRKNLKGIIESYNQLRDRRPTDCIKLVLYGKHSLKEDPDLDYIKKSPYNRDIIRTGFLRDRDLANLYAHASVFFYPSIYEGFGLPILEAMATATPVLTGNNSSLKEAGGTAALYCDVNNSGNMTDLLEYIIFDKKQSKELVSKGKIRSKEFTWKKTSTKTMEVLNMF